MLIHFGILREDGMLDIKGGVHNREGAEGVSKAILWFLKRCPQFAVGRMLVTPNASTLTVTSSPHETLVDWDYRLPVKGLLVTLKRWNTHTVGGFTNSDVQSI